eukprot:scaffold46_cov318-Pavlova_lutheri.AAC.1
MLSMLVPGIVRTRPSEQPSDISGILRGMRELQSSSKVHALESAVKKRRGCVKLIPAVLCGIDRHYSAHSQPPVVVV